VQNVPPMANAAREVPPATQPAGAPPVITAAPQNLTDSQKEEATASTRPSSTETTTRDAAEEVSPQDVPAAK
jgi:hypothetical protein